MSKQPSYRTFVEVSLDQIRTNYRSIAAILPDGAQMMPVVKANAYGHGAAQVAKTLIEAGAPWLAVSSTVEGVQLREVGIPPSVRILVMAGLLDFDWPQLLEHKLTPVLHSVRDLEVFDALVAKAAHDRSHPASIDPAVSATPGVPFHFKFDTGLSRLGSREDIAVLVRAFTNARHTRLEGVMTHFASAADLNSSMTDRQVSLFQEHISTLRAAGLPEFLVHVDATNSLHLARHTTAIHLVRPGHAIYGYVTQPRPRTANGRLQVEPALAWKTRILLVKELPAGTAVGYGSQFQTSRPSAIAVLAVGYSDGYPHQLSNRGWVLVNGQRAPILGAVSMDVTTVDVTGIPNVVAGQIVTLLGREGNDEITAIQLGRHSGTISYSILCNISDKVPRIYAPAAEPELAGHTSTAVGNEN